MSERILLVKASNRFPVITFPLGPMCLSAFIQREFPDSQVRIYDMRLPSASPEGLRDLVGEFRPTLVGVSLLSVELDGCAEVASVVKSVDARIPVMAGGPHPSSDPDGMLARYSDIDFAVVGEGEETVAHFLRVRQEAAPDWSAVNGLAWRTDDGKVVVNPARSYIKQVDELPPPDYESVSREEYWGQWSMGDTTLKRRHRYANLFTSRACPYKCTYCHDLFGKGFRAASPEVVVGEMERLQRLYGVEEFEILDDIFNFNAERLKTICRLIVERGIKARLSFPNGLRTDRLDAEQIDWLKRAGTTYVSVAIETATPRLQKQIRKNLKTDHVFQMIEEFHRRRIFTRGFFMIGFPTETKEEILATLRYAWRSKLNTAFFFIVVPYKGTEIERENREAVEAMNVQYGEIDYWTNRYNMSAVSDRELRLLQRMAVARFYANPRRVWYLIRNAPTYSGLMAVPFTKLYFLFMAVGLGDIFNHYILNPVRNLLSGTSAPVRAREEPAA